MARTPAGLSANSSTRHFVLRVRDARGYGVRGGTHAGTGRLAGELVDHRRGVRALARGDFRRKDVRAVRVGRLHLAQAASAGGERIDPEARVRVPERDLRRPAAGEVGDRKHTSELQSRI